jgi:hypothetical protein
VAGTTLNFFCWRDCGTPQDPHSGNLSCDYFRKIDKVQLGLDVEYKNGQRLLLQ